MKVGIKLWSSNPKKYIDSAGFADFVEVLPVNLESIRKFPRKYEYTTHVPHEYFGFNPVTRYELSRKLLMRTVKASKMLKAGIMVIHTGSFERKLEGEQWHAALKKLAKLLRESNMQVVIENSTVSEVHNGKKMHYIGHSPEQMKEILEATNAEMCLDLEHAAIAAHQTNSSFPNLVSKFLKLKPVYFHLSGTEPDKYGPYGHHLSIFEGDLEIEYAKKILKGKTVCLETPLDIEQRKKEVLFLKK